MAQADQQPRFALLRRGWRGVRHAATGESLPHWLQAFMTWPLSVWLISASVVAIGIWSSLGSPRITRDTRTFLAWLGGDVQGVEPSSFTIGFFAAVLLWSLALFLRLTAARIEDRDRVIKLEGAIHRAPSRWAIDRYPYFFETAAQLVQSLREEGHLKDPPNLEKIEAALTKVLESVATLTRIFARGDAERTAFSANFMIAAVPDELGSEALEKLERGRRFCAPGDLIRCSRVLWLPRTLSVDHNGRVHDVPFLALPVPEGTVDEHDRRIALPGAPWALLTGKASVFEDTSVLGTEWSELTFLDELRAYFEPGGDGEHIRSFASFRIPAARRENAVGVLNVDSSATNVLGPDAEFYATFFALVAPFVRLAQVPLGVYRDALLQTTDPFRSRVAAGEKAVARV